MLPFIIAICSASCFLSVLTSLFFICSIWNSAHAGYNNAHHLTCPAIYFMQLVLNQPFVLCSLFFWLLLKLYLLDFILTGYFYYGTAILLIYHCYVRS